MTEAVRLTTTAKAAGCAAKLSPSILDAVLKRLPRANRSKRNRRLRNQRRRGGLPPHGRTRHRPDCRFFHAHRRRPRSFRPGDCGKCSQRHLCNGRPADLGADDRRVSHGQPTRNSRGDSARRPSKMAEAKCTVVGGHSIRDDELKFGYAVTGVINPNRIWKNVGAKPGDVLLFTKAIGTGVISTALKQGKAEPSWIAASTASMTRLNREAAEALHEIDDAAKSETPIHAVTDVTGFGVLGHAREMAIGSGVSLKIDHERIEYLPGAIEASRAGFFSGGMKNNREFVESCVEFAAQRHRRIPRVALRSANVRRLARRASARRRKLRAGSDGTARHSRSNHRRSSSQAPPAHRDFLSLRPIVYNFSSSES